MGTDDEWQVPAECWREAVSADDLRSRWAEHPSLLAMLGRLSTAMRPADELRFYDLGAYTGLGIWRDGLTVAADTVLHAYIGHDLIVRWAGERATLAELFALRRVDPTLARLPIFEARALLVGRAYWRIECLIGPDLEAAERRCVELGLPVERA